MVQCHTPYTGEALGERERPPFPVGKGPYWMGHYSPAGFTGAFLVTVRETVSSSTASAGSSLAMTT